MDLVKPFDYKYQTAPYDHQRDIFMESRNELLWAILADPGTGKSKITIDTAAWQYLNGVINLLLVVAPNGVHRKWIRQEIPLHLPAYIERKCIFYKSQQTKKFKTELESIFDPTFQGLRVVSVNIDALSTLKGKAYIRRLLNAFSTLFVLDESTRIKRAGAKRTLAAINLGRHATTKRILTGTLITQGPMDAYSQFKFLSPDILGYSTHTEFKAQYGVYKTEHNWKTGKDYEVLESYRNLDELHVNIMKYSSRVKKEDCLDLPPKIYDKLIVEISPKQKKLYTELRDDFIAEFNGKIINAEHALTRLLRLQRVVGGYYDGVEIEGNAKLAMLLSYLEDRDEKVIIWARFQDEIKGIHAALIKMRKDVNCSVMYYGEVSDDDRESAVELFQKDLGTQFFVGNPKAGGIGLDLTAASITIYYTNDYSLEYRLQSEDRNHRIGQENEKILYIDIEAENTLDSTVIEALRNKKNIADIVVDKNITEWI